MTVAMQSDDDDDADLPSGGRGPATNAFAAGHGLDGVHLKLLLQSVKWQHNLQLQARSAAVVARACTFLIARANDHHRRSARDGNNNNNCNNNNNNLSLIHI